MKAKNIITIYIDPLTEQQPEGKAKLLKLIKKNDIEEYWKVKFLSDGFIGYRFILNR